MHPLRRPVHLPLFRVKASMGVHARSRMLLLLVLTAFVPAMAWAQRGGSIGAGVIFKAIGVREGMTVCEIGAGNGELTIAAARRVGPGGHVYSTELGNGRVKALQERVKDSGLAHITVVTGDPVKTNLPEAGCDALFMRNVYHHFADPGAMDASIAASLKPGARAAIADFAPDREAARPEDRDEDGTHGVGPESVIRELKAAGLEVQPAEQQTGAFVVVASKPGQ